MLPFLEDDLLKNNSGKVFHGFFGREGGVSSGIYESLNCGPGTDDDPDHVKENRARVAGEAGVKPENLLSLHQVHGDVCLVLDEPFSMQERPKADAFVTIKPGIALSILTADCAPVLFYGESVIGPVIGAAHAGWRGAFHGVLESTVSEMEKLGVPKEKILACIGPCISQSSYEVSSAFADPFITQDPHNEHFFKDGRSPEYLHFDLPGYCAKRLATAGIQKVSITGVDTYTAKDTFFSYRRATHEKAPDYGRQISVIAIKE
jgi:hypothetical protein